MKRQIRESKESGKGVKVKREGKTNKLTQKTRCLHTRGEGRGSIKLPSGVAIKRHLEELKLRKKRGFGTRRQRALLFYSVGKCTGGAAVREHSRGMCAHQPGMRSKLRPERDIYTTFAKIADNLFILRFLPVLLSFLFSLNSGILRLSLSWIKAGREVQKKSGA